MNSIVVTKLDYCYAIYAGQPKKQLNRLQSLQNAAARLIYGAAKSCHITPHLQALHWLKIPERITFKVGLLTFKVLRGSAPGYLMELVSPATTTLRGQTLRSAESRRSCLDIPARKPRTVFGDRAFMVAAPMIWNAIPASLRELDLEGLFKRSLKTHLFVQSYGQAPL